MNQSGRKGFGSVDDYTRLAPSVDRAWAEQFVLEQRLLGVPGTRIGDSLALVESHVVESGEPAHVAFGDPRSYAQEDAPQQPARITNRITHGWAVSLVLCLSGMLLISFSAQAGFAGDSTLRVTLGLLVVIAIVAVAMALLLFATNALMRVLARLPIPSGIGWILLLAAMVGALLFLPPRIGEIDVVSAVIVGVILLVAGFLVQLRAYLGGHVAEDPIIGPGEQPAKSRTGPVVLLIFPVATLVMVGVSWLLQQTTELF